MKRFPQCESITRCVRELSLVASQRRRRRRDDATATTRVRTRRAEAHAKGGLRAREPASERREGRRAKDAARSPRRAVAAFGLPATRRGERAGERGGRSSKREEASAAMAKPAIPPARAYDALYGASPTRAPPRSRRSPRAVEAPSKNSVADLFALSPFSASSVPQTRTCTRCPARGITTASRRAARGRRCGACRSSTRCTARWRRTLRTRTGARATRRDATRRDATRRDATR